MYMKYEKFSKIDFKTVNRYFAHFSIVALEFYKEELTCLLLEPEVELDENVVSKDYKSSAPNKHNKYSQKWLFGIKERSSGNFVIIPVQDRTEDTLNPII